MLATTSSATALSLPVALRALSSMIAYSAGCAIIMPSCPAMNGSWFCTCVLVSAETGTDLSRTYMSTAACSAAFDPALLTMMVA